MDRWKPLGLLGVLAAAAALLYWSAAANATTPAAQIPAECVAVNPELTRCLVWVDLATPTPTATQPPTATLTPLPTATPTRTPTTAPTATPAPSPTATPKPGRKPSPCVNISGQQNVIIEDLDIDASRCSPGQHGIIVYQSSNVTVRNVKISGTQTGINVLESSSVHISDAELLNTQRQLVIFDKSSQSSVRQVSGTWTSGGWDGISAYNSQDILIEANTVSGSTFDWGCAIIADGPAPNMRVTIRGNTVRDYANCGIGVANGSGHLVEENHVENVSNVGIYVWDQYSPQGDCFGITVRDNTVVDDNPWWNAGNCGSVALTGNSWQN